MARKALARFRRGSGVGSRCSDAASFPNRANMVGPLMGATASSYADDHDNNQFNRPEGSRAQAAQGNQPRQRCLRTAQLHSC